MKAMLNGQCSESYRVEDSLLGDSAMMQRLRMRIYRFAGASHPVLILGETGTGKELAARALHCASPRGQRPFIAVNCGAIPQQLIESELFGSVPGAFTGARQKAGWFGRAHQGTLFLDEIGDLPLAAQVVLLRTLETGEYWPVGGERPATCDVRVLCATHRDLPAMVRDGRFRQDLYHRLSALVLEMPPLRLRKGDLVELSRNFIGHRTERIDADAWDRLEGHDWPGNVRELKNVLTRSFVEADQGRVKAKHICFDSYAHPPTNRSRPLRETLQQHLCAYVNEVYTTQNGNVRATARALDVSPTTVYRYLAQNPNVTFRTTGLRDCSN